MSTKNQSLTTAIIKRTLRVPQTRTVTDVRYETSDALSRQLDIALISEGFKADKPLLDYVSHLEPIYAKEFTVEVINAIRELIGSYVNHNVYFKEFPKNVPDTIDFWTDLIVRTYGSLEEAPLFINLLELDTYGAYQHTYEEMVAVHESFIADKTVKMKKLVLAGTLPEEVNRLYVSLAGSGTVVNGDDLELLERLAEVSLETKQPDSIPVRENRAVINTIRAKYGKAILVDTVTDVLRLAVRMSGGDVTLQENTKFKSFTNKERRALLLGLEDVISGNKAKLGDVYKHREQFKRLDGRLHASTYSYENAKLVFEIARTGQNLSFNSKLEKAFQSGDVKSALALIENAPGMFTKSFNRLLLKTTLTELEDVINTLKKVAPKVATPTLIGLRQYLTNRTERKTNRLFINKKGTGRVVEDTQPVLGDVIVNPINAVIDEEIKGRLESGLYVVSRDILNVALPLSNRQTDTGFAVLPRGSVDNFEGSILRFFTYWKEKHSRTDLDLSAIMLDKDFNNVGQLSYTNLRSVGGVHSGDITSAPNGASEFIDIEVDKVAAKYIVPQVNRYAGENFDELDESFFGYMSRTPEQKGKPFEAKTVKSKAEMRGKNGIALPLVFTINDNKTVTVKWVNAFLQGYSWANATENNKVNTATIMRSVVETNYLTVEYLVNLLASKSDTTVVYEDRLKKDLDTEGLDKVVYIGRETPSFEAENLETINLTNLHELL